MINFFFFFTLIIQILSVFENTPFKMSNFLLSVFLPYQINNVSYQTDSVNEKTRCNGCL